MILMMIIIADIQKGERMSDCMIFPDTVEEFMEQYKMVDTEHIYSNGIEYVPIFRMKQWFEHLSSAEPEPQWIPCSERLPASNGIYIVDDYRYGKHWIHTVGYMKRSNSWCEQHGIYYDDKYGRYDKQEGIIAWMPMPEPYKEKQK